MRLFDSHCHLQDSRLQADIGNVMARAAAAGIERMVCCGCTENDWEAVRQLSARHPRIIPSYALHPLYLANRTGDWVPSLVRYLRSPGSAVGEIGLDHYAETEGDDAQEEVFLTQLQLARDLNRPVTIHCRRAWGRLVEILEEFGPSRPPTLFHSYSGSADLVPRLARLGASFSFSGSVTSDRNVKGRKALLAVPDERLMLETDSPDLLPAGAREAGAAKDEDTPPNEPANLVHIVRCVAKLKGIPEDRLAELAWRNSCAFFRAND